jgi:hypothetical protein
MRADVTLHEDTTTRYLRWEIVFEGSEPARLRTLGGPLTLRIAATDYVDNAGKHYDRTVVEVPIHPHPGRRNQAQAKFTTYEARRAFLEALQRMVTADAADFVAEAAPGSVSYEGRALTFGPQDAPLAAV